QILGLVVDNASNNATMLESLEFELEGFQGALTCVCCIGHILNLCVKVSKNEIECTYLMPVIHTDHIIAVYAETGYFGIIQGSRRR
ncbi:hypothetical protein K439DRAFT_1342642, partial [Ramaria rubella]